MVLDLGRFRWIDYLIVGAVLLVVAFPRFNQQDLGPIERLAGQKDSIEYRRGFTQPVAIVGDAKQYLRYALFFKGEAPFKVNAPFSYRPLVPLLGAMMPVDAFTGINIVNLIALILTTWSVTYLLDIRGAAPVEKVVGGVMYAFSFPVFYYGTTGLVDATAICFISLGFISLVKSFRLGFIASLVLGAFVKETIIILVPVAACYMYMKGRAWRNVLWWSCVYFIVVAGSLAIVRVLSPSSPIEGWKPSLAVLRSNLRPRAFLSFILAFGLPGLLSIPEIFRWLRAGSQRWAEDPTQSTLVVGVGLGVALSVYGFIAAHADGRFIWHAYPFLIPLCLPALRSVRVRFTKTVGQITQR